MSAIRRFLRVPEATAGAFILALLLAMALSAPLLFPGDPQAIAGAPLLPPFHDWSLPLGTDRLGRDVLAETIKRVGAARCVMSTDGGGMISGLFPDEQFRMFGQRLQGYDVPLADIYRMMRDNPTELAALGQDRSPLGPRARGEAA